MYPVVLRPDSSSWLPLMKLCHHTHRTTTLGMTPLDGGSAQRRKLYLTTHNNHKRQTSLPQAEFEPTVPASECLSRRAAGIGNSQALAIVSRRSYDSY